jgi:putative ABC transport system ATP-binding protein
MSCCGPLEAVATPDNQHPTMSLQAHNPSVAFDGKWIFRNASLTVECGQRLSLVGPSGSGKSLFLKSLAMLHRVDEGHIEWEGQSICGSAVPDFRSRVMYVPQRLTDVDGNVTDFLSSPFSFASHANKTFELAQAKSYLQQLGRSDEFLSKSQRDLSGGERQIVALVRALILNPNVLLLDEPTSAMDGEIAASAESLVASWCGEDAKRATIWVTHDLQQAQRVSDRIIEMNQLGASK